MRTRTTLFLLVSISTLLVTCIDQVDLPIRTEEPRLVVEGQITNEAPPYTVRLTYTGKYGGTNGQSINDQYVKEAQVTIADDQNRSTRFVSVGQGLYRTTDSTFRGQVGRAYSLTVVLADGKRYVTKSERMPAVPVIDSISSTLVKTGNLTIPYAFSYGINTNDPANEQNYYRWSAYGYTTRLSVGVPCSLGNPSKCNYRCWTPVSNDVVNIYSDEAINGNPLRNRFVLQVPIYAIGPQLVEVQQFGMTQTNYQFWKLYQQQNARTGSIFDPLPAPVTGNLVNASDPTDLARGYFAVTSVTRRRYRQQNYPNVVFYSALVSFISSQIIPDGDCRNTYGNVPIIEPEGW
ncbi:DUF4249 family protein [Spirosoma sp. HMF3257]|uniref:DUF4249 domain-containing protein n=1 Tax=Spirosoma telluris TaxID=2183553 RepID=A0A327NJA5_9BACT|nr:DUF4249 family protein [Spirosoma telluris]RAI75481.1 DUF4249 domain-containing protein [Spirosoma telluris]